MKDGVIPLNKIGKIGTVKVYNQAYVDKQQKCIEELEQENATLKKQLDALSGDIPWSKLKDISEVTKQITEAKEIIKEILDTPQGWQSGCEWYENEDYDKVISKAEQFLNDEVKE